MHTAVPGDPSARLSRVSFSQPFHLQSLVVAGHIQISSPRDPLWQDRSAGIQLVLPLLASGRCQKCASFAHSEVGLSYYTTLDLPPRTTQRLLASEAGRMSSDHTVVADLADSDRR